MEHTLRSAGGSQGRSLSDAAMDLDLMDELLSGQGFDSPDLLQLGASPSTSPFGSLGFSPVFDISNSCANPVLLENDDHGDSERSVFSVNQLPPSDETQSLGPSAIQTPNYAASSSESDAKNPSSDPRGSWWIQPRGSIPPVEERFMRALRYIKESQRGGEFLVQMWVPTRKEGRQVLTTCGQPFSLDLNCQRLVDYRTISMQYHFSAEENSHVALGLPGRVFVGKVPEWTPDVRYFTSDEYPRVGYAQHYDVRGSIALPMFDRHSRACLGVVELVMTVQKTNYNAEIESICNALQAVDLRSSEVLSVPRVKVNNVSYQVVSPEIQMVLKAVCETHGLPLAQTWIPCIQQGKRGSRHSDENYEDCVSTVDSACYVQDPSMLDFHQACSEHHLFRGQGVVGRAFTTNQPCFSPNITTFSKIEYPLSHYAMLFGLRAAVAIRLRSIHTGTTDYVLEFFLPVNCQKSEEQKLMLNSLSITIQQVCQSLRVLTAKELEDEAMLQVNELLPSDKSVSESSQRPNSDDILLGTPRTGIPGEISSWISSITEAQQKGARNVLPAAVPLEFDEEEIKGFGVTTQWDPSEVVLPASKIFSEFKQHHDESVKDTTDCDNSFSCGTSFCNMEKIAEKRRTKTEKTVSLQELRKHFAGSLKDAAKNLGVCPTTLKRICRQHGITRWPSRKIKKVGHSLKKLQVVIDSVHGPEGAFQFSTLYENFTKSALSDKSLSGSRAFSGLKEKDHPESSDANQQQEGRFSPHTSGSNSFSSSSCSQSSASSLGCASGTKQCTSGPEHAIKQETSVEESHTGMLEKAQFHTELQFASEEAPRPTVISQSPKFLGEHHSSGSLSPHKSRHDTLKVKAIHGEDKVILRLQPSWGFTELRQEIGQRFNIGDPSLLDLKYLDDDSEWILLTCDADLQECIEVYKSSYAHTIKISVHRTSQPVARLSLGPKGLL